MKLWKNCFGLVAVCAGSICISHAQLQTKDSLLRAIRYETNDTLRVKYLRDLGFLYTRSASETAKSYLNEAITLGNSIQEHEYTAGAYTQLSILYANVGHLDSADYFLQQAATLAALEKENIRIWTSYYQAEGIYYNRKGDYKQALDSYLKGLRYLQGSALMETESEAGFYINIGNIHTKSGSLQQAIEWQLKGLRIFEKLGNKRGVAYCFQNIGDIFITMGRYLDGLKYLKMAAPLKEKLGDKKGTASLLKGMSLAALGMGKYSQALAYVRHSISLYKSLKIRQEVAAGYLLMSRIYRMDGNRELADNYLRAAARASDSADNRSLSGHIVAELVTLGGTAQTPSDTAATLSSLQHMLSRAHVAGDSSLMASVYQSLSVYYARRNDFRKAYDHLTRYNNLQKSITGADVQVRTKELETRYRVEKKEKQILLLEKNRALDVVRMQEQRFFLIGALLLAVLVTVISLLLISRSRIIHRAKRLLEMEKMRNHIARDLHDDIGSTLSSIQLMGSVALKRGMADVNTKGYLEKIVDNSRKMSASMQDIVWAINPVNDGLDKMILRMKEYAAERLEPLDISYHFTTAEHAAGVGLPLYQRKDLFMIYKEVINNAVKYSACDRVTIDFLTLNGYLRLAVTDNGTGFDLNVPVSGNGLNNMRARACQIKALFDIRSEPGKGTSVYLSIPIP